MIWPLFVFMSLVAAALIGMPLMRRLRTHPTNLDSTPAVLLDQLNEVLRDQNRGVISAGEAKAAEQEIKRRILMHSRKSLTSTVSDSSDGRTTLILCAILAPLLAAGYYASMGSPQISSIAFAERAVERQEAAQIADLSSQLYDRLTSDPAGGPTEGWMLLGQTYSRMGRYSDAAEAFGVVAKRPEATSAVFSLMAEALIYADQGVVTPRAETAIDRAVSMDPGNPAGTFYKAIALAQNGEANEAYILLSSRLNEADQYYPWMQSLAAEANRIGAQIGKAPISMSRFAPIMNVPGPTQEDVANAQEMSENDRQAFILSMVERLATRLEDEPEDLDGWMRLGNAYVVLEEITLARSAFERARDLLDATPENADQSQLVEQALGDLPPNN